ncbi:hypothetical protein A2837_00805 [Candidatus Kaiserbacteria bacterium RIFCSPHIGHO2_01_FULL_46_22]|uniref:Uncharacterized protein n=1 Tax=Candidatus Kaiserbacteria bacterium RIFCSPHIGHO2_01_FULL_46_22 TaxID=1798475 RepID=A0A1F6BXV2_9BACT|nr:MAG: hypothetical protein A2837_00805 [Candidatus Kaiserbacteria bacterium RIFCSPHIGHO2_01_FULL_46_22]
MKYVSVKNPLTIIAIFAGIAEVSGTVVITHLNEKGQDIFVWFLALFPTLLVVLFFITLWFKHTVLYAPSDFSDEQNFMTVSNKGADNQHYEPKALTAPEVRGMFKNTQSYE